MTKQTHQQLTERALKVREHIIGMSAKGGCFIGASLSCVELIVYLYSEWLHLHKEELNNPGRDYFFLSKGHDVPALYGTLAETGIPTAPSPALNFIPAPWGIFLPWRQEWLWT